MTHSTIGIDVSKDWLDVHCHPDGTCRRFTNGRQGHRALLAWLSDLTVARVVYEPTGAYHQAMERALHGLPLVKVNPRQARRFAEATGQLAKTDRIDARMLALMGDLLKPAPKPLPSQDLQQLKQLQIARQALIKDRTAAKARAKLCSLALLKRQNADRLKQVDDQLSALDAEIARRIAADPALQARCDILCSIPGIAKVTAATLLIEMPELGCLEPKQAACLAGLAPLTRQSGSRKARAHIAGGRGLVRQALYMPALVAARYNPDLKAKYQALLAAGKPPKLALTALMRKLVVLANTLLRHNRSWALKTAC